MPRIDYDKITDLAAYRDKAFSALRLIPDYAFRRGLAQMEADLARSPIPAVSRYLLIWADKGEDLRPRSFPFPNLLLNSAQEE